jgi:peptidoglycan/xylan/chitin deacetylase (PgdA/CDA1 family)
MLSFLKTHFEIRPLSQAIVDVQTGNTIGCRRPLLALTVDDGFGDNYEVLYPVLRKERVPLTIFLATDYLDSGRPPWPTRIEVLLRSSVLSRLDFPFKMTLGTVADRDAAARRIRHEWRSLSPEQREDSIAELKRHLRVGDDVFPKSLTWAQVREMRDAGVSFGSHTAYHSMLPWIGNDVARRELALSKERVETELQEPCTLFAYPNGDWDQRSAELVREAGYVAAMSQDRGANWAETNRFSLRRIDIPSYDRCCGVACRTALVSLR